MTQQNIHKEGDPNTKRWAAIYLMRDMCAKGESPEAICAAIYATRRYKSYNEVVNRYYNWAIKEGCYGVEGCAEHPPQLRRQSRGIRMNLRQTAADIMKANADRPMGEVLPLIAAAIKRSKGEARSYYRWIVTHDRAPGVLQAGWIVFSSPYETPRSCVEAIAMLRENLGSANSDPDVVDQLLRDLSNFDAMSQPGNSYKLKMNNRCMSQKALDLMSRCSSFDQWNEQTTNEHSTPMK